MSEDILPSKITRLSRSKPDVGAADDLAVDDGRTRDRADLRYAEDLANFGATQELLDLFLVEETGHGLFHVVEQFVDDRVALDFDVLGFGDLAGLGFRANVEADDDRVRTRSPEARRFR